MVPVRVVPSTQKPSPSQVQAPRPQSTAITPAVMPKFAPVPPPPAPAPAPVTPAPQAVAPALDKAVIADTATEKIASDGEGLAAVDYRKGLLSVVSEHATLAKVLTLVGGKIGATIEVANDVGKEAVVAHLGPASPDQVLRNLLDSPSVDYIIMGGDEVNRVIVRRRQSFGRQPLAMPPAAKPASAPAQDLQTTEGRSQDELSPQTLKQENEAETPQGQGGANPPR